MQNSLYHEFSENATSVVFAFACCRLYNIELLGIFAQMLPKMAAGDICRKVMDYEQKSNGTAPAEGAF